MYIYINISVLQWSNIEYDDYNYDTYIHTESKPTTSSSILSQSLPHTFSIIVNYIDKYNIKVCHKG